MRIRLTNRKTGETLSLSGAPSSLIPVLAVQLGAYGILVNSIPEAGPEVPICRCSYGSADRIHAPDCDIHSVQAPVSCVVPINAPRGPVACHKCGRTLTKDERAIQSRLGQKPCLVCEMESKPVNPFAEALFQAGVNQMAADAKRLRVQRAIEPGGDL